jgi:hypothetical protein
MVETKIDPIRVPSICLSAEELSEMEALIDKGDLPKDFLERHFEAVRANVFGVDAPRDKNGKRQEQGLGSKLQPTQQSIDAYKRWCRDEPDYERHLKRMESELAAFEASKKTKAPAKWSYR